MKTALDGAIPRLAGKLVDQIDELVDAMFTMLARDPALEPFRAPELEYVGRAIARADLLDEIHALGRGCEVPQQCPAEVDNTARSTAELDAPVTIPLQCYRAGHRVLWEAVQREADLLALTDEQRRATLDHIAAFLFEYADRCSAFVVERYTLYRDTVRREREHHHLTIVRRLLSGDRSAAAELDCELQHWHLGVIGIGRDLGPLLERVSVAVGRTPLVAWLSDGSAWAWYTARGPLAAPTIEFDRTHLNHDTAIGFGSCGEGLAGFQRTHRQARRALRVASLCEEQIARYRDVALEALLIDDDQQARDFIDHELAPLDQPKPARTPLRYTVSAYFACGQNMATTAARLGIHERTVSYRLNIAHQRLGYPVSTRRAELEAALRLEALLGDAVE